jgi:GNAT superfamily N-acetyltransferase
MGAEIFTTSLMERIQGPIAGSIGLRPAIEGDEPFLYRVYASTREEDLRFVDWDRDQKAAFLKMQFAAQSSSYRDGFPGSGYDVILDGDEPVGRLFVHRDADAIRVVDIGLLPEYRNQGIGGALLRAVLDEAAETGRPVRLHVESFNRAATLYRRLGFGPIRTDGIHVEMEWAPPIAPD